MTCLYFSIIVSSDRWRAREYHFRYRVVSVEFEWRRMNKEHEEAARAYL